MTNTDMIKIIHTDLHNKNQAADWLELLNLYALDPMGGGKGLSKYAKQNLISTLQNHPGLSSVIAYVAHQPAGLINCFQGFSTFSCKPLLNIHDVTVKPEYRGLGISSLMLQEVEKIAVTQGCCKLTLEVLGNNSIAKASYIKAGFKAYELDPKAGQALFWEKPLI